MDGGVATDSAARPTAALPPPSHYRPQLDGLRAVAVYLVVAYHAGVRTFSGGFIGVDVFFVLSGYLVTLLLLRDLRATDRIDFRRFYSRRIRRLLPAAFVALVVTAAVYTAIAAPADVSSALGGFRSAFLYVANWHFIRQSNDYFAANVNTNPVVHFWSLAVEEQFYLCWPILLSAVYVLARRAGDRQWDVVRLVIAAGFTASLLGALHLSTVNVSRAYYGTDTRAYELLAGALLAITPSVLDAARRRKRSAQALAPLNLALLIVIGTRVVHLGEIQRGVAATIATCGLIIALEVSGAGVVNRVLSAPSATYLGRVSYGTYLWHWPVIVIATQRFHPNSVSLFALTCLIGTALAALSFEVLEQHVRMSAALDRHRAAVIAIGLATSLVGGLVVVPAILHHDRSAAATSAPAPGGATAAGETRTPVPADLDLDAIRTDPYVGKCIGKAAGPCVVVSGRGPRVLLMGDSHAEMLIPAFAAIARTYSLTLAVAFSPNCPWQQGLVEAPAAASISLPRVCRGRQDAWYRHVVPEFDPSIVVLAHHAFDDPNAPSNVRLPDGTVVSSNRKALESTLRTLTSRSIDELRKPGRKILVIEPLPVAPGTFDPFTCLSKERFLDACRYVATARPTKLERYYRSIANGTDLYALDLDRLVCPYLPICDPIVHGVVVKIDPQHITAPYSQQLAKPIAALLVADGILPRS